MTKRSPPPARTPEVPPQAAPAEPAARPARILPPDGGVLYLAADGTPVAPPPPQE